METPARFGPTTSVVASSMAMFVLSTVMKVVFGLVVRLEASISREKISDALFLPCAVVADTPWKCSQRQSEF